MPHAESAGQERAPGLTAYLAELQCFLCGTLAGSLETDRSPLPSNGIWHPAADRPAQRIADWRQIRCARCGGALYVETVDSVIRQHPDELRREIPRRGRPPKWLVEERRLRNE